MKAASGYDDAMAILRRNGAYDAKVQEAEVNATPPLRPYGGTMPHEGNEPSDNANLDERV